MKMFLMLLVLTFAVATHADERVLKAFERGSAQAILDARAGRPFVLTFWSVDCVHCRAELAQLSALAQEYPDLDVVLVSTDTPAAVADILDVLRQYPLPRAERWVFADEFTERLRFEVDPRWRGELPRTYLHGPGKAVASISGRIEAQRMARWLQAAKHGRD